MIRQRSTANGSIGRELCHPLGSDCHQQPGQLDYSESHRRPCLGSAILECLLERARLAGIQPKRGFEGSFHTRRSRTIN